jgi:drug/metabolite transporter (DMT)-like permease
VSALGRVYFSACAGLIGYVLFYTLPIYARLPRTFYDPVARRWQWARGLGPIPMGYVGQILWGIGGGVLCALVAVLITSRLEREPSERAYGLWAAWSLTALGIVMAYFTWNNWP